LSRGMTQRLGIAGGLLDDPGLVLPDELVNGLDPEDVAWIRNRGHRLVIEDASRGSRSDSSLV
jgi:ABC-2 type transport system ATP-binding protein